jgi:hypothetical protein
MYDRWQHDADRSTDHDYFEKTLAGGEILITKVSRSGKKTMSPGRFSAILSDQLRVSAAQFWDVIRLKKPAERPSPEPESAPVSLSLWLAQQLERAGVKAEAIEGLDDDAARALLNEIRSRPSG